MRASAETPASGRDSEPTALECRGRVERVRVAASATGAAILGLAPHVLHHAGPLAGAALFAGIGGTLLFGAVGLLASIPLLIRLHRRHGGWQLPAAVLALFVAMFSLSSFVIGPALTGSDSDEGSSPTQSAPDTSTEEASGHESHH